MTKITMRTKMAAPMGKKTRMVSQVRLVLKQSSGVSRVGVKELVSGSGSPGAVLSTLAVQAALVLRPVEEPSPLLALRPRRALLYLVVLIPISTTRTFNNDSDAIGVFTVTYIVVVVVGVAVEVVEVVVVVSVDSFGS